MEQTGVKRLVLASSLSVYDWAAAGDVLREDSPLERRPEERDAYTKSKILQEQLARECCARHGIALTILRPGVIWGFGRDYPPTIGQQAGPLHVLIGSARQLLAVHVENCADAFAAVLGAGHATEGTFNVIDHPDVTVGRFVRDHLRRSGRFGVVFPAGYRLGFALVKAIHLLAPRSLRRRLPSFVAPARFAARYKPVRIDGSRLRDTIGWRPPISYEQCLDRTYVVSRAG
jgi:UDP-glucose 4-epimerase